MAFSLPNRPMALDSCVSVPNKIYFVVRALPSPRIPRHAPIREERIEISRLQSGRVGKCITRRLSGVWATYPVVVGKPVCKPGGGFAEAVPRLVHRLIHQRKGELSMLRWRVMHLSNARGLGRSPKVLPSGSQGPRTQPVPSGCQRCRRQRGRSPQEHNSLFGVP